MGCEDVKRVIYFFLDGQLGDRKQRDVKQHLTLCPGCEQRTKLQSRLREFIRKNDIPVLRSPKLIRFDAAALGALEQSLRGPIRSPGRPGGRSVRSFRGKGDSAYERLMSRRASGSPRKKRPAEKSSAGDARSRGTG